MAISFSSVSALSQHGYDAVIDVRSPAEFEEDHVPGAVNMPVLSNEERARVGTVYKQDSAFKGRKVGAALVFRNAARHIETHLSDKDGAWRPLVYCWRGGQRSGAFAWMLREIGWRSETIEGGYKSYRRMVSQSLYEQPLPYRFIQLGGHTGTAKTALLPRLRECGLQVIDLEGLAGHRGSLLGEMPGGQPSQKSFESALIGALTALDADRPVLVEAESSKIGARLLPPSLWEAMRQAPWIEVTAPIEARASYLAQAYADILSEADPLMQKLDPLRYHRGNALVDHWNSLISQGDKLALCKSLAEDHYDPAYTKSKQAYAPRILSRFETDSLTGDALDALAARIAAAVQAMDI